MPFRLARSQGDALIVCVIKNEDVRRGPDRPVFDEALRLENAASLEFVDYVCLVSDKQPFECVRKIKPDIFVKGESLEKRDKGTVKKHTFVWNEEMENWKPLQEAVQVELD